MAVVGVVSTAAGRRTGQLHLAAAALLEVLLLVQAVVAVAGLIGGHHPKETAAFLGYLVGLVLVPVAGVLWARSEPTRWAGTVLVVAAVVVAIMDWRLIQLWNVTGA
nr:hypothetical protein [Petropleomorpha daqingensis]